MSEQQGCGCFERTLLKMQQHIQQQLNQQGVKYEDLELNWQGRAYILSGDEHSPVNPKIEVSYQTFKKNGEPTRNRKKDSISIMASHCAFCGREYQKETKEQTHD